MSTYPKVLMAMSGGLDSSVAALLLRKQGYDVIGITLDLWTDNLLKPKGTIQQSTAVKEASELAQKIGIPHYVIDGHREFEEKVIQNFIGEYLQGHTPNPCVQCNLWIKWKLLIEKADELHCDYIATGHYARVRMENQRYILSKGIDNHKDQSYMLWALTQDYLKRTLFPLGNMRKENIRQIAREAGYHQIADKRESYDVCFIPDGNYRTFLNQRVEGLSERYKSGNFLNADGVKIGSHEGYPYYTIGQRKGLKIALGKPQYVTNINSQTNEVTIADKEFLLADTLICRNYNLIKYAEIPEDFKGTVKIRYRSQGGEAIVRLYDNQIYIYFMKPISAITSGQSAVIYENEDVVGGGIII